MLKEVGVETDRYIGLAVDTYEAEREGMPGAVPST